MVACLPLSINITPHFLLLASYVHSVAVALRKGNKDITKCRVGRASLFPVVQNINRSDQNIEKLSLVCTMDQQRMGI